MTGEDLLQRLEDQDVLLTVRDGMLEVTGPVDELSDDLIEELRRRKQELLAAFAELPSTNETRLAKKPEPTSLSSSRMPKREAPDAPGPQRTPATIGVLRQPVAHKKPPTHRKPPTSRVVRPPERMEPSGVKQPPVRTEPAPARPGFLTRLLGHPEGDDK